MLKPSPDTVTVTATLSAGIFCVRECRPWRRAMGESAPGLTSTMISEYRTGGHAPVLSGKPDQAEHRNFSRNHRTKCQIPEENTGRKCYIATECGVSP